MSLKLRNVRSVVMNTIHSLFVSILLINLLVAQNCEDVGLIKHINWDNLMSESEDIRMTEIPNTQCNIEFDVQSFELTIDCDLEYLGYATDNLILKEERTLGITYHIGMTSFSGTSNTINSPGTCGNRKRETFDGLSFKDMWTYSEEPLDNIGLNNGSFAAYPEPSNHWSISMKDTCTPINYRATFSWTDLTSCQDAFGRKLIVADDDGTYIKIGGTVYVSLVSPHAPTEIDSGIYRVYPLVTQDWGLMIKKQINAISSTNTKLFVISIVSIYEDGDAFKIMVVTQCADFIKLSTPNVVGSPLPTATTTVTMLTEDGNCLSGGLYTCSQMFVISTTIAATNQERRRLQGQEEQEVECETTDFSGTYKLRFSLVCSEVGSDVCNAFIDSQLSDRKWFQKGVKKPPKVTLSIELEFSSSFQDTSCDPLLYTSVLDGNLEFYDDEQFSNIHDESDPYVIGQDKIYAQVSVAFPGTNYDVFDTSLMNVFVCTVPDIYENDVLSIDQVTGLGGCLSEGMVDPDGLHYVITNGVADSNYGAAIHFDESSNIVRFSFDTFANARKNIFVHVQTMLELQPNSDRRRLVTNNHGLDGYSSDNVQTSNQFRHFVERIGVSPAPEVLIDAENEDEILDVVAKEQNAALHMKLIAVLISIVIVVGVLACTLVCALRFRSDRLIKSSDLIKIDRIVSFSSDAITPCNTPEDDKTII